MSDLLAASRNETDAEATERLKEWKAEQSLRIREVICTARKWNIDGPAVQNSVTWEYTLPDGRHYSNVTALQSLFDDIPIRDGARVRVIIQVIDEATSEEIGRARRLERKALSGVSGQHLRGRRNAAGRKEEAMNGAIHPAGEADED